MKKSILLFAGIVFLASCSDAPKEEMASSEGVATEEVTSEEDLVYPYFAGAEFDQTKALEDAEVVEIIESFNGSPKELVFTTEITENCKKKGCWMKVAPGEKEIRVSFKDYDFFVPLDSKGHQTTLNGVMFYDTLTVEQLRHYAMDANASQDSLDNITEPIITLSYEATGVYVQ
jgi:hypothetical protein